MATSKTTTKRGRPATKKTDDEAPTSSQDTKSAALVGFEAKLWLMADKEKQRSIRTRQWR